MTKWVYRHLGPDVPHPLHGVPSGLQDARRGRHARRHADARARIAKGNGLQLGLHGQRPRPRGTKHRLLRVRGEAHRAATATRSRAGTWTRAADVATCGARCPGTFEESPGSGVPAASPSTSQPHEVLRDGAPHPPARRRRLVLSGLPRRSRPSRRRPSERGRRAADGAAPRGARRPARGHDLFRTRGGDRLRPPASARGRDRARRRFRPRAPRAVHGAAVPAAEAWATPLGEVPIDPGSGARPWRRGATVDDRPHASRARSRGPAAVPSARPPNGFTFLPVAVSGSPRNRPRT